jgi:hypothetical protein
MPPPEFITQFAASTPQNGYLPGRAYLISWQRSSEPLRKSYQHFSISALRVRIEGSRQARAKIRRQGRRRVGLRDLVIRRCEPEDYKAVHLVYSSPQAMAETLGVPYSSEQAWREELARERDDDFAVVACVQGEVVGHLSLSIYMNQEHDTQDTWG